MLHNILHCVRLECTLIICRRVISKMIRLLESRLHFMTDKKPQENDSSRVCVVIHHPRPFASYATLNNQTNTLYSFDSPATLFSERVITMYKGDKKNQCIVAKASRFHFSPPGFTVNLGEAMVHVEGKGYVKTYHFKLNDNFYEWQQKSFFSRSLKLYQVMSEGNKLIASVEVPFFSFSYKVFIDLESVNMMEMIILSLKGIFFLRRLKRNYRRLLLL
jgi:hypothetical protein